MSEYRFEQFPNSGLFRWSCRRGDSGIVGFGPTPEAAQREFEAIEEGIWPASKQRELDDQIEEALSNGEYSN